jgi:hypothetical protein
MAKAIYDVQVPNIGEVERALGDMRDKAPRAMKNAVNQTATRAKNMMIRQARLRYAVNSAGRRHLNALKVRNRATTQNPTRKFLFPAVEMIWVTSSQTRPFRTWGGIGYCRQSSTHRVF